MISVCRRKSPKGYSFINLLNIDHFYLLLSSELLFPFPVNVTSSSFSFIGLLQD